MKAIWIFIIGPALVTGLIVLGIHCLIQIAKSFKDRRDLDNIG